MNRNRWRRAAGVTLIELMIVVIVIGILAAIAVPSYRSYLLRANRADAKAALLQLQASQEKFYLQNNAYTDKLTDNPPAGLGSLDVTTHGYYKVTVTLKDTDQGYDAKATPIAGAGQTDDKQCGEFRLSDSGARSIGGTGDVNVCWK